MSDPAFIKPYPGSELSFFTLNGSTATLDDRPELGDRQHPFKHSHNNLNNLNRSTAFNRAKCLLLQDHSVLSRLARHIRENFAPAVYVKPADSPLHPRYTKVAGPESRGILNHPNIAPVYLTEVTKPGDTEYDHGDRQLVALQRLADYLHNSKLFLDEATRVDLPGKRCRYIAFAGAEPGNIQGAYQHYWQHRSKLDLAHSTDSEFIETLGDLFGCKVPVGAQPTNLQDTLQPYWQGSFNLDATHEQGNFHRQQPFIDSGFIDSLANHFDCKLPVKAQPSGQQSDHIGLLDTNKVDLVDILVSVICCLLDKAVGNLDLAGATYPLHKEERVQVPCNIEANPGLLPMSLKHSVFA